MLITAFMKDLLSQAIKSSPSQPSIIYEALRNAEDPTDPVVDRPTKRTAIRRKIALLVTGLLTTLLLVSALALFQLLFRPPRYDQCGYTPEEARRRGCTFDLVSFSWLPDDCLDAEIEAEFLNAADWHFFHDINATVEASLDEVRRGEAKGFYVPWTFHTAHCGYLFKKLHRAVRRGGKVDSYIWDYNHTMHCVQFMLDPPPEVLTAHQFTFRKYPYCGREGGVGVEWPH